MKRPILTQTALFWQSHCTLAASTHEHMAELQAKAGRPDLAQASRETAKARRIASANMDMQGSPIAALAYGEDMARQEV